jgi:hypothetical protein
MSGEFILDDIAQFILGKIDSVVQLEVLLLLRSEPEDRWSVQALAGRLYIDEKQTAEVLTRLCAQSFVVAISEPPLCQYCPGVTERRQMVHRLYSWGETGRC